MNHHGWKYSTLPALRQVPAVRLYAERTPVSRQAMNGHSPAEAAETSPRTTTDSTCRGGNGSRRCWRQRTRKCTRTTAANGSTTGRVSARAITTGRASR